MDLRTNSGSQSRRVAYVRTVKTASGAVAVQIVNAFRRGSRSIEHLGSAHDDGELEAFKAAARHRLAAGQGELGLGLGRQGFGPASTPSLPRTRCYPTSATHSRSSNEPGGAH